MSYQMTLNDKFEAALAAIEEVFDDTSEPIDQIIPLLEGLKDSIDQLLDYVRPQEQEA